MQEYEIEFYDKADGSEPAKEFILALDEFSAKHSVEFTIALSGDAASASDVMKKYL